LALTPLPPPLSQGEMEQMNVEQKALKAKVDGFDPGRNGYDELTK
jgi:hypothetical protein